MSNIVLKQKKVTAKSLGYNVIWSSEKNSYKEISEDFRVKRLEHNSKRIDPFASPMHSLMMFVGETTKVRQKVNGKSSNHLLHKGTIDIISAGAVTEYELTGDCQEDIVVQISPKSLESVARECNLNPTNIELKTSFVEQDKKIEMLLNLLQIEMNEKNPNPKVYGESLIQSLIFQLVNNYVNKKPQIRNYKNGLSPHSLKNIEEYIEANLHSKLSLEALAGISGYSPFYFLRMFKASKKTTPHEYILMRRVEKAKKLLKLKKAKIADIALETGFSSQSHLSSVFKRMVGVTPNEFQRLF